MSASFSDAHVARTCCAHMLRAHVAHMLRNIPRGVGAEVVVQPGLAQVGVALTLHRSCYSGTPPGAGRHHMCSVRVAHVARAHPARIPRASRAHMLRTCCAHVAHMLRTHSGGVGAEVVVQPGLCM